MQLQKRAWLCLTMVQTPGLSRISIPEHTSEETLVARSPYLPAVIPSPGRPRPVNIALPSRGRTECVLDARLTSYGVVQVLFDPADLVKCQYGEAHDDIATSRPPCTRCGSDRSNKQGRYKRWSTCDAGDNAHLGNQGTAVVRLTDVPKPSISLQTDVD